MKKNIILATDSYKVTHFKQYPPKTQKVFSYFESRGGDYENVVFFGLQYILKEYLTGQVVTKEKIDEAEKFVELHLGDKCLFNRKGWEHILKKHSGRLPLRIKAVPEGTSIPVSNVLMTVESTDPECYWLTNYVETLLVQVWFPSTVATLAAAIKGVIESFLILNGDEAGLEYKLHDFGFRGVSSTESAAIGGAAHSLSFKGSDTMVGARMAMEYYSASMPTTSIPAAEHSTITSWGKDNEVDAFKNMLDQYPTGLVAVVSDSFDIYKACSDLWGKGLKEQVLNRDGTLIVRPDSGDPIEVIVKILDILGDAFGYTINAKGCKVLNPKIRVIQGDGVDIKMISLILTHLHNKGWSADNIVFGMGGALLQKLDRDTQKFAFKCSSITVDGEERDVFKQPVDCDWKKSKAGRLVLWRIATHDKPAYLTLSERTIVESGVKVLKTVFEDGEVIKEYTFEECRNNLKAGN